MAKSKSKIAIRSFMTPNPITIGPHESLSVAHDLMKRGGVRHLPVVEEGVAVGLVSERDLFMIERYRDVDPTHVEVHEAMAPSPYGVAATTPLTEVLQAMVDNCFGSALVTDGEKVIGIFTTVDALRALRQQAIRSPSTVVASRRPARAARS